MADIAIIVSILQRYQQDKELSESELTTLEQWLRKSRANQELFDDLSSEHRWKQWVDESIALDGRDVWKRVEARINAGEATPLPDIRPKRWGSVSVAVAAAVLVGLLGIWLLYQKRYPSATSVEDLTVRSQYKNDVPQAYGRATLTLSSGQVIGLDTATNGTLAGQQRLILRKTDSQTLVVADGGATATLDNVLATTAGSQYQLVLPDGTHAWLNSMSTLRFPSRFHGANRQIAVSGEVYLEVAKNSAMPFVVDLGGSSIRVTGTHFDIRHHPKEPISTSLLEGHVVFRHDLDSVGLIAGQQVLVMPETNRLSVIPCTEDQVLAWQKKLFWFQDASLEDIMKEISRAYPVQVRFSSPATRHYTMIVPRSPSLIEILKKLEDLGHVRFRLTGNQVEVIPLQS